MTMICPLPGAWARVWERLDALSESRGFPEGPPTPLVLAGWTCSNDLDKKLRWEATVQWAERHGVAEEIKVRDDEFYAVKKLHAGPVGPFGGPLHLPWRFGPAPIPESALLDRALHDLQERWTDLDPQDVTRTTKPTRFTGRKFRRLAVAILDRSVTPPWGTWSSLAPSPHRRRFTELRSGINEIIAPHHVDHVAFV